MKFNSLLLLLPLTLALIAPASAIEITGAIAWGEDSTGKGAGVFYKSDYGDERYLKVYTAHSAVGEQRLYFTHYHMGNKKMCSTETYLLYPDNVTLILNGQAVKASRWCKRFEDSNNTYYQYTPQTEAGLAYTIKLLKTSATPIEVHIAGETLYIPVMGFTRVWNSGGGDAI